LPPRYPARLVMVAPTFMAAQLGLDGLMMVSMPQAPVLGQTRRFTVHRPQLKKRILLF
jgi:hypothetical protein